MSPAKRGRSRHADNLRSSHQRPDLNSEMMALAREFPAAIFAAGRQRDTLLLPPAAQGVLAMAPDEPEWMALYEAFLVTDDSRLIAPPAPGVPRVQPEPNRAHGWRLWEGYLDAAGLLTCKAMESESLAARLIFPALFNLRHALEVALKWHIDYAGGVVPRRAGHDLLILIQAFRATAEDLDDDANYLPEYVLSCAAELASLDPHATAFRYPSEASDELMKQAPASWDLARLSFTIQTISMCLEGLDGQIDLSRNEEYQAHMRSR